MVQHAAASNKRWRYNILERCFEAKLQTMWTDAQPGRSSSMETVRREKMRDGEDQKKKTSEEGRCRRAKKVGKLRNIVCFPMICASKGSKNRLANVVGRGASWPNER